MVEELDGRATVVEIREDSLNYLAAEPTAHTLILPQTTHRLS